MANKAVSLLRKCKVEDGSWKRYPVVFSKNGRVKPNTVIVGGQEHIYPIGHYTLRSFSGSKLIWTRVDGGATEALAALKIAQERANVVVMAEQAGVQVVSDPKRVVLRDAAKRFAEAARNRGSMEAAEVYERSTDDFLSCCPKLYADELNNEDIGKWQATMRKRGLKPRTIANRHMALRAFLLNLGIDVKAVAGPAPRYDNKLPEVYEADELKTFFDSLTDAYDQVLFRLLLTTGLRENEAAHLEWADISYTRRVLKVESKPKWEHSIKDAEERGLPLTDDLLDRLKSYHETLPGGRKLVFGRRGGAEDVPEGHLLRRLQSRVKKAGLNVNDWWLHKFRATYITRLLRNGMDLRTVMKLSGHSDLESVMRYLRPAETQETQAAVNAVAWY